MSRGPPELPDETATNPAGSVEQNRWTRSPRKQTPCGRRAIVKKIAVAEKKEKASELRVTSLRAAGGDAAGWGRLRGVQKRKFQRPSIFQTYGRTGKPKVRAWRLGLDKTSGNGRLGVRGDPAPRGRKRRKERENGLEDSRRGGKVLARRGRHDRSEERGLARDAKDL